MLSRETFQPRRERRRPRPRGGIRFLHRWRLGPGTFLGHYPTPASAGVQGHQHQATSGTRTGMAGSGHVSARPHAPDPWRVHGHPGRSSRARRDGQCCLGSGRQGLGSATLAGVHALKPGCARKICNRILLVFVGVVSGFAVSAHYQVSEDWCELLVAQSF